MVIGEYGILERKKFSPFGGRAHMLDDPWHQFLIFFLGILLIEHAILFPPQPDASKTLLASDAEAAVLEIRATVVGVVAEEQSKNIVAAARRFVDQLGVIPVGRIVLTIANVVYNKRAVAQMLAITNEIRVVHIAALEEMISRNILHHFHHGMRTRMLLPKYFYLLFHCGAFHMGGKTDHGKECAVLLLGFLLVENAKTRMPQVHATETIRARAAIHEKHAVFTVVAFTRALDVVTAIAGNTVEAEFAVTHIRTVNAVSGPHHAFAAHAVFRPARVENKITILVVGNVVAIIAVFIPQHHQCEARHDVAEHPKLSEERL